MKLTRKQKMIALVIVAGLVLAVVAIWHGMTPVRTTNADYVCRATSSHSELCEKPHFKPGWLAAMGGEQ